MKLFFILVATSSINALSAADTVHLNWLGSTPPAAAGGVSWGVPWPKGSLHLRDELSLKTVDGKTVPLQTWPMAYWPDGSLKWTGHAIGATQDLKGPFDLSSVAATQATKPVEIRAQGRQHGDSSHIAWSITGTYINIDTGPIHVRLVKHGSSTLFESITAGDKKVAENGRLVLLVADKAENDGIGTVTTDEYISRIDTVTMEQAGPIRATVKIEGTHVSAKSGRSLLPFVVRLYFYAGQAEIRMTHSIIFDADSEKDFVRGLGFTFGVPFREELQNRHVRFAGDTGMWAEPVKPLSTRQPLQFDRKPILADQLAARRIPNVSEFPARTQEAITSIAAWGGYRLTQLHSNGFSIEKRTQDKSSWLHVTDGHRSSGLAFVGDLTGGVAVAVKDFWEKYPASLEINGARDAAGNVTVWFWSPDAKPMDMRHYDVEPHGLDYAYEDAEPGFSTPYGIANTSQLTLWGLPGVPSNQELVNLGHEASAPPLLVCTPEYYHTNQTFGVWSLPDRSNEVKSKIEDQLEAGLKFYANEVEQRYWYGYWNFGDMMRMYDEQRHEWKYDVGGWAWTNTELMPNLWLWYSFLRTGRADIFRLAEAMTRHTQEVDCYHLGRFAGLGSRHNVSHWGDGAKQPRISNAALKNVYYYLTTDERVGDLLHEVVNADFATAAVNPLRNVRPTSSYPTRSGFGFESTWPAFAINWMTEWERTRDPRWKEKILIGMKTMMEIAPPGQPMAVEGGYDPQTGRFYDEGGNGGGGQLAPLFGGPEICFQLMQMIDYPEFWKAWTEMAGRSSGRLLAYAAKVKKDPEMAKRVWLPVDNTGNGRFVKHSVFPTKLNTLQGPDFPNTMQEAPGRPEAAGDGQRMLNMIECLDLASEYLPEKMPDDPAPTQTSPEGQPARDVD